MPAMALTHLVGLVIVDGQPVALVGLDPIHVLPGADDASAARDVAAGDHFEQRRLARAVGAEHADDFRLANVRSASSENVVAAPDHATR